MKTKFAIYPVLLAGLLLTIMLNCKKEAMKVAPTVTITEATNVTANSATVGSTITADGGTEVLSRGVCWNINGNPTISDTKTTDGKGMGSFTSSLTGLTASTTYYVRAYATNSEGTAYGNQISITTISNSGGTVTDIDGNVYNTVIIGTQVWMVENLKTTKYRNGDPIPNVTGDAAWVALNTGAYCWDNNDAAPNKIAYGALYNWYSVADSRNIAPTGWHVPTDAEWTTLTTFLGGESVAGGKLKETGTTHWQINTGATNSSGFTALPGGIRYLSFVGVGYNGNWWSSTANGAGDYAWIRYLYNDSAYVMRGYFYKLDGYSVRCVRD